MNRILLIKTNCDIIEKKIKGFNEQELYKQCKHKNDKDFINIHTFHVNDACYKLYAKTNGRAGSENKYDLPPPVDTNLYFGILCIIKIVNDEIEDLSLKEWEGVYEELFGGFEDIEDSDGERSVDTSVYSEEDYTKEGYLKDNFVVEDDELEEEEYESYED